MTRTLPTQRRTLSSMEKVPRRSGLHISTVKIEVDTIPLLIPTRILTHSIIRHANNVFTLKTEEATTLDFFFEVFSSSFL